MLVRTHAPDVVDALVHVPEAVALVWPIDELLEVGPHAVVVVVWWGEWGGGHQVSQMIM